MQRILQILFGIFLFSFPFGYRWLVYEETAYRFGHFNPFVSGFVYLPEILLVAIFVLWVGFGVCNKSFNSCFRSLRVSRDEKTRRGADKSRSYRGGTGDVAVQRLYVVSVLFVFNALLVTFWRGDFVLAMFFLVRMLEMGMLYCLLTSRLLSFSQMARWLLWGVCAQVGIAFLQYYFNHSIGLGLLGESKIGADILNVAKTNLVSGIKQIRGYGTFLHPNILAGYLLLVTSVIFVHLKGWWRWLLLLILLLGLYVSGSHAAWIVFGLLIGISFLFSLWKEQRLRRRATVLIVTIVMLVSGLLLFDSHRLSSDKLSFEQRFEQNSISRNMIIAHPFGVGVRNFTLEMELANCGADGGTDGGTNCGTNCGMTKLKPWEFQPVHNVFLLTLNETGIQGLLLLLALIFTWVYRCRKQGKALGFFALLLFAPFDHFLWDSWAGMMLIVLVFAFLAEKRDTELSI